VERVNLSTEPFSQVVIALKIEYQLICDKLLLRDEIREIFSIDVIEVKHLGQVAEDNPSK
jgi:hypothetical protein